jgi:hypothetical protein
LARATVPAHILERLTQESFSEMEAEFRDGALASFGSAVRDQAIFTVWTLRKISDICQKIVDAPTLPKNLPSDDLENFKAFAWYAVLTRFHLDCLLKSMQVQQPIYPEVREVIIDGLRGVVNAYAWARQALDLRCPEILPEIAPVKWDEEEQSLLDEATFDLLGDPA